MRHIHHIMFAAAIGCTSAPRIPAVRFANQPPIAMVDDRRDVPVAPAPREDAEFLYHFDGSFLRLITRTLEVPRTRRALGVNALDEVPDSTWFTNRIGTHDLTPEEIRRGPAVVGSPEMHKPWTIKSTKVGGASVGFIISDARGEQFLLKFDEVGHPEAETAADAITSRLMWACGYHVSEDHVVHFRSTDLVLARNAVSKDAFGNKSPLTRPEVDSQLARIERLPDGRIRGLASRILDGKWLGGHSNEGVRSDDPNDRIAHELRRDLRGMYAIAEWVDNADIKEANTLDMWVADPDVPERHYVKHYQIDFGKSLGFMAASKGDRRTGHEYFADWGQMFEALVTLGIGERSWEHRDVPELRGVGLYEVDSYQPGEWKADTQAYVPFRTADRVDKFWGAKILIRFTRQQLRAAVEAGQLTDPRAADYFTNMLVARQRATARYWFEQVNPLDRFVIAPTAGGHALCFDDLALAYGLAPGGATRYTVTVHDRDGHAIGKRYELDPGSNARTCSAPLVLSAAADGYTMLRIDSRRTGLAAGTIIHLARDPITSAPRIIGVWRL